MTVLMGEWAIDSIQPRTLFVLLTTVSSRSSVFMVFLGVVDGGQQQQQAESISCATVPMLIAFLVLLMQ